jgi:hypothetical protein
MNVVGDRSNLNGVRVCLESNVQNILTKCFFIFDFYTPAALREKGEWAGYTARTE